MLKYRLFYFISVSIKKSINFIFVYFFTAYISADQYVSTP